MLILRALEHVPPDDPKIKLFARVDLSNEVLQKLAPFNLLGIFLLRFLLRRFFLFISFLFLCFDLRFVRMGILRLN